MNYNISPEILDRIHKINIRDYLLDKYGIHFGSTNCKCPHPDHHDNNPSFTTWQDKDGSYHWCCHGCHCGKQDLSGDHKNYGNDIIAMIRWLSDYKGSEHVMTFQEAAKAACDFAGISLENTGARYSTKLAYNKTVAEAFNANLLGIKQNPAYQYLKARGLDEKDIADWLIGYNGERITFPLFNRTRDVIAFSNRVVGKADNVAKYINSANSDYFHKSEYLYGIHRLDANEDYIFITEGQLDVIAAYKYGLKNVVAALGKAFTAKHIEQLKKFPNIQEIIFVFDADAPGQEALPKSAALARASGFSVRYVILPQGLDLFDYAMQEKEALVESIYNNMPYYFYKELIPYINEYERTLFNLQSRIIKESDRIESVLNGHAEKNMFYAFLRSKFGLSLGGSHVPMAKRTAN